MIIYQSKSKNCQKLLELKGVGDWSYKDACALTLGDIGFIAFFTIAAIMMIYCFWNACKK